MIARWNGFVSNRRIIIAVAVVVAIFLLTFPLYASPYQLTQIAALSMLLGIVALSLVFLAGYGGMVSLAQAGIYGLSAYTIGILTVSHSPGLGIGPFVVTHAYPWWVGVIGALVVSLVASCIFGIISVRSQGIYFLMITLALGMIVYNFALENYDIFNGHGGIGGEKAPVVGGLSFDAILHPKSFYFLTLIVATILYIALRYLVRSPFGLALQGIRDNPRRMRALGYWVEGHRVAAFTLAGLVAGAGGILYVWYYQTISPDAIDLTRTINILVIAVIGGMIYFEGAFVGALAFILVTNFASSYTDRYNTVIGMTFLLIVLFSPNGLIGLPQIIITLPRTLARWRAGFTGSSIQLAASPMGERAHDVRPPGVDPAEEVGQKS